MLEALKSHKTIRNRIRFFSWSGLWAEIKLWWIKRRWKRTEYPPFYDPRTGSRTVTKCGRCGKTISIKYGSWPPYTDYFIPTYEASLKDMRKVSEAEYFPNLKTEAALDELMKKEIR